MDMPFHLVAGHRRWCASGCLLVGGIRNQSGWRGAKPVLRFAASAVRSWPGHSIREGKDRMAGRLSGTDRGRGHAQSVLRRARPLDRPVRLSLGRVRSGPGSGRAQKAGSRHARHARAGSGPRVTVRGSDPVPSKAAGHAFAPARLCPASSDRTEGESAQGRQPPRAAKDPE